jgi:hypothetical protein
MLECLYTQKHVFKDVVRSFTYMTLHPLQFPFLHRSFCKSIIILSKGTVLIKTYSFTGSIDGSFEVWSPNLGAVAFRNRTRIRDICRRNLKLTETAEHAATPPAPSVSQSHHISVSCQQTLRVAADDSCSIRVSCRSQNERPPAANHVAEDDGSPSGLIQQKVASRLSLNRKVRTAGTTTTFDVGKQLSAVSSVKCDRYCSEKQHAEVAAAVNEASYSIKREQPSAVCSVVQLKPLKSATNHSDVQPERGKLAVVAAAARTFTLMRKPLQMLKVRRMIPPTRILQ